MKNITKFNTETEYINYIDDEYSYPNLSLVNNSDINYEQDYSKQYLTIIAMEPGYFTFSGGSSGVTSINYSLDNGQTWVTLNKEVQSPLIQTGKTILLKGDFYNKTINTTGPGHLLFSGRFSVFGNIMSLAYGDNFINNTTLKGYIFAELFSGSSIMNALNLILPSMTLANWCYAAMFHTCKLLETAPVLPAPTLSTRCYNQMFENCKSLNYVKCLATDISASLATVAWFRNASTTGTFVKANETTWSRGEAGIPSGWRIENNV